MPDTFTLEVITPYRVVVKEEVEEMTAPGELGEFGVLPGHTHYLTALRFGELKYRKGKETRRMVVNTGFAEIEQKRAAVLVETAELAEEIDTARAEAARDRAIARLKAYPKEDIDLERARAALTRAMTRLSVATKGR